MFSVVFLLSLLCIVVSAAPNPTLKGNDESIENSFRKSDHSRFLKHVFYNESIESIESIEDALRKPSQRFLFLEHLFRNESISNYIRVFHQFHVKLIRSANSDCISKNDEVELFLGKYSNSSVLWQSQVDKSMSENVEEFTQTCFNLDIILRNLTLESSLEESEVNFENILQLILIQYDRNGCDLCKLNAKNDKIGKQTPGKLKLWLYAFLFTSTIVLTSLTPIVLIPFINRKSYRFVLMILISLAIGVLCGSGFLYLIPEALGIVQSESGFYRDYLFKSLSVILGIYLFYVIERLIKLIASKSSMKKDLMKPLYAGSIENLSHVKIHELPADQEVRIKLNKPNGTHTHHGVQPIAWIVIFSDTLHKFIDGISIGAAFSDSFSSGVSLTIAIVCEEVPHQLGDFAILTNAGIGYKATILIRLLCSLSTYVGTALGIILGETLHATEWICALAAGMFIYIGLCDMVPELSELVNELEISNGRILRKNKAVGIHTAQWRFRIKLFIVQNLGIIAGFCIMFILALFSDHIKI